MTTMAASPRAMTSRAMTSLCATPRSRAVGKKKETHPDAAEGAEVHPETLQHYHESKREIIDEIHHWQAELEWLLPKVQELRQARFESNNAMLRRVKELE